MDESKALRKVRNAMVSGLFYPEDKDALYRSVQKTLSLSAKELGNPALAILSPHAAFAWAGSVQGEAWNAVRTRKLDQIVILADLPRHEKSAIILPESSVFETPLGSLNVNSELCEELETCGTMFIVDDIPHLQEHSIEVQLPFAKFLFPGVSIVPILLAGKDPRVADSMARALDLVFAGKMRKTLFVASSNVGSCIIAQKADKIARRILECIVSRDVQGLFSMETEMENCNASIQSITSIMQMNSLSKTRCEILMRHDSSGKRDNSVENVVHYAAAGWFQ